jgi:hypothetical protein
LVGRIICGGKNSSDFSELELALEFCPKSQLCDPCGIGFPGDVEPRGRPDMTLLADGELLALELELKLELPAELEPKLEPALELEGVLAPQDVEEIDPDVEPERLDSMGRELDGPDPWTES